MCGETIKGTVRKRASTLLIEKSTGIQWCIGYAPKKHSIGGNWIED